LLTLNLASLRHFDLAQATLSEAGIERLPSIEIQWDNFCTLDAEALAGHLSRFSDVTSFHVMWSRFLERDDDDLRSVLARMRRHVEVIRPSAVSDHLCRFRSGNGAQLLDPGEHDYADLDRVCARVDAYQEAIRMPLLIENYASTDYPAEQQVAFLERLMGRTGCGLLFDVSNAVAGALNGFGDLSSWEPLIAGRDLRCHVGSYQYSTKTELYLDTHTADLSGETLQALRRVHACSRIVSLSYERDGNDSAARAAAELRLLSDVLAR
jgi:uncharacterized protein (UPF0276 family)